MRRLGLLWMVTAGVALLEGADLELAPDTLKAWEEYIRSADARLHGRPLWVEESADRMRRVRAGEIVVGPAEESNPRRVPAGLIHDWIGAAFFPGVRAERVMEMVRDYGRFKEVYRPGVIDARLLRRDGLRDDVEMLLRSRYYFKKTAFDGEFESNYVRVDHARWYSVMRTRRMQEIENYASPGERKLPPDHGNGLAWRLEIVTKAEERDSGVYFEMEALVLSRDVPAGLRWMAGPIIRHVAAEALAGTIRKTREAVDEIARNLH